MSIPKKGRGGTLPLIGPQIRDINSDPDESIHLLTNLHCLVPAVQDLNFESIETAHRSPRFCKIHKIKYHRSVCLYIRVVRSKPGETGADPETSSALFYMHLLRSSVVTVE